MDWATLWWKLHDPNFNRFCLICPCDRQTDGRAIGYSALCIYAVARAKNLAPLQATYSSEPGCSSATSANGAIPAGRYTLQHTATATARCYVPYLYLAETGRASAEWQQVAERAKRSHWHVTEIRSTFDYWSVIWTFVSSRQYQYCGCWIIWIQISRSILLCVQYGSVMSATAIHATVLLCCLIQQLDCISLAPVYWNMSNPMWVY